MDERYNKPDLTLKNVKTVFLHKRQTGLVLSCRECPEGVSPKSDLCFSRLPLLSACLAFLLYELLRDVFMRFLDSITPDGCGKLVKILIHVIAGMSMIGIPIMLIVILLSFRFCKWIPASSAEKKDGKC